MLGKAEMGNTAIKWLNVHSPVQLTPSPAKPFLHSQVYEPSLLMQAALMLQLLIPGVSHSFTSETETYFMECIEDEREKKSLKFNSETYQFAERHLH